jgi:hypothetical protein
VQASPAPDSLPPFDNPEAWLGPTELLDLGDPKLRLRARSLTQLAKNEREKALAIYGFVKRVPFATPFKLRLRSPREVIDAGRGDGLDKVGLFLALTRIVDIPSRIRFMRLPGEMLRGLISNTPSAPRPVAELWVGGRWVGTDTYIFDAAYMAAARQRLNEEGWECGYGIHRDGAAIWNGVHDAYLTGDAIARESLGQGPDAVFADPAAFLASAAWRSTDAAVASVVNWNLKIPGMGKVIRELREEAVKPPRKRK